MKKIVEITKTQVIYVETNEAKGIDLKTCNQNYIEYKLKNGQKIEPIDKNIVGQRKITGTEYIVELFTIPFARFVCETLEEYETFNDKISKNGWSLINWS